MGSALLAMADQKLVEFKSDLSFEFFRTQESEKIYDWMIFVIRRAPNSNGTVQLWPGATAFKGGLAVCR